MRKKLNAMALEFVDKSVLIVDGKQIHCNDRTMLYDVPEPSLQIRSCAVRRHERSSRWRKTWERKK